MLTASLAIGVSGISGSAVSERVSEASASNARSVATPPRSETAASSAPRFQVLPESGDPTTAIGSRTSGDAARSVTLAGRGAVQRLRRTISERRTATYRHQDALGYPHTRTAYRERQSASVRYLRWLRALWTERADSMYRVWVSLRDPREAICHVFGLYCSEALAVSWCESKFHVTAGVGKHQYLGLFQMGTSERATYGHGWTALEQARAAYRYFVASGRDWSPWSCRP